jgi:group I intron endonuclease
MQTEELFYSEKGVEERELKVKILRNCGIYIIQNNINNHIYIGSSINVKKRFNSHRNLLNTNKHPNSHLQAAWNKYGRENFTLLHVERISTPETRLIRENKWIKIHKPEYNNILVNNNNYFFHSAETKEKIRQKALGREVSDETKAKIKETSKGRVLSEKTKQKISESNKGKSHGVKSIKILKQTSLAISESNKKRIGALNPGSRKVINTVTGEIFNSGKEASDKLGIPISTLRAKLIGTRNNDTSLIYLS